MKKSTQIKMIRGALKSKKTPRQFLPSLRSRLAKLTAALAILFVLCGCAVRPVIAQTPVSIVPYQQVLATNLACTGAPQVFSANNRNLNQHTFTITAGGTFPTFSATICAVTASVLVPISDQLLNSMNSTSSAVLTASGYYPQIDLVVTCTGASTFSILYSGTSGAFNLLAGAAQISQTDKLIAYNLSAGTTRTVIFQTPFANAASLISFSHVGTGPTGSTLSIRCSGQFGVPYRLDISLGTTNGTTESFPLPPVPCNQETVVYTAGGASANTYVLEQIFSEPGLINSTLGLYSHVTTTTAAPVKATAGTLTSLTINTAATGTVTITDLATAACTATPATNIVAVISAVAAQLPVTLPYNISFVNGICVKSSVAMDLTVGYQ